MATPQNSHHYDFQLQARLNKHPLQYTKVYFGITNSGWKSNKNVCQNIRSRADSKNFGSALSGVENTKIGGQKIQETIVTLRCGGCSISCATGEFFFRLIDLSIGKMRVKTMTVAAKTKHFIMYTASFPGPLSEIQDPETRNTNGSLSRIWTYFVRALGGRQKSFLPYPHVIFQ